MKFIALALFMSAFSATAAEVVSAKLDASKKNLLVDVRYGGGCKKHTFELQVGGCLESMPVQCSAKLVEKVEGGFDPCEAIIGDTVVFNLKKYGLADSYYSKGKLTITGDKNFTGKPSTATVTLP